MPPPCLELYPISQWDLKETSIGDCANEVMRMTFGKRVSMRDARSGRSSTAQQTCARCSGTGSVVERGVRIACKPCKGTGKVDAKSARRS